MDGMYYINWGWDGMFDGYFALTALNPDGNGAYGKDQTAIIGILKSTGGDIVSTPKVTVTKITLASAETITRSANSDNFTGIKVECALQNSFTEAKTVQSGFALYQGTELKSVLGYGNVEFSPGIVITPSSTFGLGAGLTDGTYRIVPVYRESESAEWIAAEGSNYRYVEAVIAGNTLTLKVMPDAAHDERLKFEVLNEALGEASVCAVNEEIVGDIVVPEAVEIDGKLYKVTTIAYPGFANCRNMTSIKLPSCIVTTNATFQNCSQLKELTLPKSLNFPPFRGLIVGCDNLTDIKIEEGNTSFSVADGTLMSYHGEIMVGYAGGLATKDYVMPESIMMMSGEDFAYNNKVETVTLSPNITFLPYYAFWGCTALKTVYITDKVETIQASAFESCSIEKIDLKLVKNIENYSFRFCKNLEEIVIPPSVMAIGDEAFYGCVNLKSIII